MRRRLRKKLRIKEFDTTVIAVAYRVSADLDDKGAEALFDVFCDILEANKLQIGGGPRGDVWRGFVEHTDRWGQVTEDQAAAVRAWLQAQPLVLEHRVSPVMKTPDVEAVFGRNLEKQAWL